METKLKQPVRSGYAIFRHYLFQGTMPACYDETDYPVVFAKEIEAQRDIAATQVILIRQFLDGQRDYEDASNTDEFVLPVDVWPDRSISIEDGRVFGKIE